jgi:prevent-host-death family protein
MVQVNTHDAKTHFSKLLKRVQAGEEVIIARGGKPVAKLVPLEDAPRQREFGRDRGKLRIADDFNSPLPDDLMEEFYK